MDIFIHGIIGTAIGCKFGQPVAGLLFGILPDFTVGIKRRDYHISNLSTERCKEFVGLDIWNSINKYGNEQSTNAYIVSIEMNKRLYEKYAGNQDYSKNFQQ